MRLSSENRMIKESNTDLRISLCSLSPSASQRVCKATGELRRWAALCVSIPFLLTTARVEPAKAECACPDNKGNPF